MKKYLTFFVFLCFLHPAFSEAKSSRESPSINWSALSKSFQAYVEYPSAANASKVTKFLPESEHVKYTGSKIENEAIEVIYQGLPMLQRQVEAREKQATRLAFRLMTITDGASSEALDIMLGKLIRIDPKLFLEEFHRESLCGRRTLDCASTIRCVGGPFRSRRDGRAIRQEDLERDAACYVAIGSLEK